MEPVHVEYLSKDWSSLAADSFVSDLQVGLHMNRFGRRAKDVEYLYKRIIWFAMTG